MHAHTITHAGRHAGTRGKNGQYYKMRHKFVKRFESKESRSWIENIPQFDGGKKVEIVIGSTDGTVDGR
jgi:hypothetical protein